MAFPPLTQPQLLDLWRRLFPASYTTPIEDANNGQGFDVPSQQAAQFSRAADAAAVTSQAYYLRPHSDQVRPEAAGERAATGTVEFTRAAPAAGKVTLPAGTTLLAIELDTVGGLAEVGRFALTADLTLAAGTFGPTPATVTAARVGYQGNVPSRAIVAFASLGTASVACTVGAGNVLTDTGIPDSFGPAMLGRYVRLVGGLNGGAVPRRVTAYTPGQVTVDGPALLFPDTSTAEVEEWADLGITVSQPGDLTGGRSGFLDAIARDRGVSRQAGESDYDLRARLVALADTISPAAVMRAAARVLDPLGLAWRFLETRDPATLIGMTWDLHAFDYGTISDGVVFAPATRFFVLAVAASGAGEFGFPFDTPFPGANAWDVGCFDGYPAGFLASLLSLWNAVEGARAAGVGWALVIDPTL